MREAKALKEYFKIKELFIVIGIVMCIPYIPLTQKIEKNLLLLGFPYKFYSIHINTQQIRSIHFSIGNFLLNIIIIYTFYILFLKCYRKIYRRYKNEE